MILFPLMHAKAGIQFLAKALGPRFRGDERSAEHALRFTPEEETGGLKPYLHVRRELWALVTRALFYDLVELGEERDIDGRRMFGVASSGEFYAMAPADSLKGLR